jgi:hypothetical protein
MCQHPYEAQVRTVSDMLQFLSTRLRFAAVFDWYVMQYVNVNICLLDVKGTHEPPDCGCDGA